MDLLDLYIKLWTSRVTASWTAAVTSATSMEATKVMEGREESSTPMLRSLVVVLKGIGSSIDLSLLYLESFKY